MTNNQKLIQEKYMALKSLKQQVESAKEQLEGITTQMEQIGESLTHLKEIAKLPESSEILVPVSNGVFIRAAVTDSKRFIVNVGASAGIEKDLDGVESILSEQRKELSDVQESIAVDLGNMEHEASKLSTELKELMN